ncbi:MAG: hypothetical protein HON77_12700 [Gammaproteobacteria bacterium]|jgi:hypothetical protein|nr:hypothetical protein [Gammaproteobacteria bacterium]MBT6585158.1 hypothetical protein [Gammaproteobacteria bacterium]MDG1232741.1 hypothetical protein [Pseudomonadales bacterium]
MLKIITRAALSLIVLLIAVFSFAFFSSRPPLTIDPATLAGDGSTVNYCELPVLDGRGKMATDIPKGNTPGCSYDHFPLPVLRECTESLPVGVADIRGLWIGTEGKIGHVERLEQCGSRVVITSSGVIHDGGPNSTAGPNSNDTEGAVLFTIGEREFCPRTSASMTWNNGILDFNVFGWGPVVVRRYPAGDQMVWEYADGSVTRMDRICKLPEVHKNPKPRGRAISFFAAET